jgi:NAD(P)H-dependent FMN reductase
MSKPKVGIIVSSVRPNRFADHPTKWIFDLASARGDWDVEILDLRDYPLPLFNEAISPGWGPSKNEVALRWQEKIASLDAFIIVAAEYNRGPTAALKNALDYAYHEWNNKPVAFVGYGGVGGARAVEQLRLISVELQMAPTRAGVHILGPVYMEVLKGEKTLADYDYLTNSAQDMLNQLAWWTDALKTARESEPARKAA